MKSKLLSKIRSKYMIYAVFSHSRLINLREKGFRIYADNIYIAIDKNTNKLVYGSWNSKHFVRNIAYMASNINIKIYLCLPKLYFNYNKYL